MSATHLAFSCAQNSYPQIVWAGLWISHHNLPYAIDSIENSATARKMSVALLRRLQNRYGYTNRKCDQAQPKVWLRSQVKNAVEY